MPAEDVGLLDRGAFDKSAVFNVEVKSLIILFPKNHGIEINHCLHYFHGIWEGWSSRADPFSGKCQ